MTLASALTNRLIHSAVMNIAGQEYTVWVCSSCGQYLVYYLNQYHWVCDCHKEKQ